MAYSNGARVELTRESVILEERIRPTTDELNSRPLRVNKRTWIRNLEAAEETAYFNIDYCRHLSNDDSFRPNSSADCARALGTNKTDKDSLSELANEGCTLAGAIIDARSAISRWSQLRKWKTFAEVGYVHPVWDSCGCPHGRYTSASPCLTNRIEPIRETVEPDDGFSFLSLDFSQAEYVVWASLSKDQVLATLFLQGRDFHVAMAESILKAVPSWNLRGEEERAAGKTINFAVLYQMKPHTLARKLGCSVETATRIIKAYYGKAPVAQAYIAHVLAMAEELGYAETYYGRRRYCPEYKSMPNEKEVHELEKTLWNHVNAGTSAELVKRKQILTWEALRRERFTPDQVRLSLNMFDEVILTVRDDCLDDVRVIATEIWRRKETGFLPFAVGVKSGKTWRECSR